MTSDNSRPAGSRASLVDAVMDLPGVLESSRLEATVPLGDAESLERLRDRTDETVTRPAGSIALVDGDTTAREPCRRRRGAWKRRIRLVKSRLY